MTYTWLCFSTYLNFEECFEIPSTFPSPLQRQISSAKPSSRQPNECSERNGCLASLPIFFRSSLVFKIHNRLFLLYFDFYFNVQLCRNITLRRTSTTTTQRSKGRKDNSGRTHLEWYK